MLTEPQRSPRPTARELTAPDARRGFADTSHFIRVCRERHEQMLSKYVVARSGPFGRRGPDR